MPYKIIRTKAQYDTYCKMLLDLTSRHPTDNNTLDEIDLITLLIEKWDEENTGFTDVDPVNLLKSLMAEHHLKSKDLALILGVGTSLVSEILNYRKGFSKKVIRGLSSYFKLREEAFNKPYKLITPLNSRIKNASVMNNP